MIHHGQSREHNWELVMIRTSNSFVKDSGRGTEVERTTSWVHVATLAQVGQELDFVSVEVAREVQLLAAHHSHLAALQQILGDNGGQAAKQMAASIDNNGLKDRVKKKTITITTDLEE